MLVKYSVAGLTLASEVPLPELASAAPDCHADWTFQLGSARARPPRGRWFHRWTAPHGRPWLSFGRDDGAYVLRFAHTATFRVSHATGTIVCEGAPRVPARTVRHLLLNQVLPLALTPSKCVLHAGAVVHCGGAIGFAGQTGAGKSTLSVALSRAGARMLCDDALVLEQRAESFVAVPTCRAARLWPDSVDALFNTGAESFPAVSHYNHKRIVHLLDGSYEDGGVPLRLLCVIAPRQELKRARGVDLRQLSPRDALMRLTPFVFHLDVRSAGHLRDSFERLATIVERVAVVELVYPWRLRAVSSTADQVLRALAGVG